MSYEKFSTSVSKITYLLIFFRTMVNILRDQGRLSIEEQQMERNMTAGCLVFSSSFFFFSGLSTLLIVLRRLISHDIIFIETNLENTKKILTLQLMGKLARFSMSLNIIVSLWVFTLQNKRFRKIVMAPFNRCSNAVCRPKKATSNIVEPDRPEEIVLCPQEEKNRDQLSELDNFLSPNFQNGTEVIAIRSHSNVHLQDRKPENTCTLQLIRSSSLNAELLHHERGSLVKKRRAEFKLVQNGGAHRRLSTIAETSNCSPIEKDKTPDLKS